MMLTQTDQQANFLALDALHKRSQWLKKFIGKKALPRRLTDRYGESQKAMLQQTFSTVKKRVVGDNIQKAGPETR